MPSRHYHHRKNYNIPGHAHELTFSCYKRYVFLKAERTCQWLAEAINDARTEHRFDLWAFVFMPEHVHLAVHPQIATYDIAKIRASIKAPVAIKAIQYLESAAPEWLNRISRRRGNYTERLFWQSGGGYDRNIESATTLWKMIEYIHMNPVRRGLVERAVDWKWSSAIAFAGGECVLRLDRIPAEWCAGEGTIL